MSDKPTLHLLGIPHTITRPEFSHDAFTNKVRTFAPMMRAQGYPVIHYGVGGAQSGANLQVDLLSEEEYNGFMGGPPKVRAPNWMWAHYADSSTPLYHAFNQRLAEELRARVDPQRDLVCCPFGTGHREALDALPQVLAIETGIGYPTSYLRFRVFESYAWMHNTIGREGSQYGHDYRWVVPSQFDLEEWPVCGTAGEYLLLVGRIGRDKGIYVFREMARHRPDLTFLFVGQGDPQPYLSADIPNLIYRPPVLGTDRADLYARAIATVCMTRFLEPFCQVHIESQLCGTPVIASNFGVFAETVVDGENGYRCNTLGDTLAALEQIERWGVVERSRLREAARARYGLHAIGPRYDQVFQQVDDLRGQGYYTLRSRHGPITKAQAVRETPWQAAQKWERAWWTPSKYDQEQRKQTIYAALMLMPWDLDFRQQRILDLGCGPVSLLQRARFQTATAVDPLDYGDGPEYAKRGIRRIIGKGEDFNGEEYDEVWFYNVLQHVEDPHKVIEVAKAHCVDGGRIRFFEWLNIPPCPGHPHELKEELFAAAFNGARWARARWSVGSMRGETLDGDYLAAVVEKLPFNEEVS